MKKSERSNNGKKVQIYQHMMAADLQLLYTIVVHVKKRILLASQAVLLETSPVFLASKSNLNTFVNRGITGFLTLNPYMHSYTLIMRQAQV